MALRIFIAIFIIIPVVEIAIFLWIGQHVGTSWTLFLIAATALVGAWLAKRQGMQVIRLAQVQIQNRDMPSEAILDGLCVLIGGILLIFPGFATDFAGLLLMVPWTRKILKTWLKWWFANLIRKRAVHVFVRRR